MKTIVVFKSTHHGNTRKVAETIARVLDAELVEAGELENPEALGKADVLGFGSGVYFGKLHQEILSLIERLPPAGGKRAFFFSTSGTGPSLLNSYDSHMRKILQEKGFEVAGGFSCRGYDTYGLLGIFGGINRGRPNKEDLRKAEQFARDILRKLKEY
ncbi:flavodoxin [Candidatus Micrarchaeota archaeon]|nr:flavodoxin [Candidatus Micrarchaeota archaeon]